MSPNAAAIKQLLYISDPATDDVYVYNDVTQKLVGTLTGFQDPQGQCVDRQGDVWIASWSTTALIEYAHGGTQPLQTLKLGNVWGNGCSISPTTGALAATSFHGTLYVWANASGTPAAYSNPSQCGSLWAPGYDDTGNLYVQGGVAYGINAVCELPAGGSALVPVRSNVPIVYPAGVMWDGKYLTLADQNYQSSGRTGIYWAKETRSGGLKVVGGTTLDDPQCPNPDTVDPFIVGTKNTPASRLRGTIVLGGDASCHSRFDFWAYPQGGNERESLPNAPFEPTGQSVSFHVRANR